MHADEKVRMVIKLINGEIKECGENSSLYLEFLQWMMLKQLALSLIVGENRGWGGVCRRRVRDSGYPCFGRCIITQVGTRCKQISLLHHQGRSYVDAWVFPAIPNFFLTKSRIFEVCIHVYFMMGLLILYFLVKNQPNTV